jgi:hypothetical protein
MSNISNSPLAAELGWKVDYAQLWLYAGGDDDVTAVGDLGRYLRNELPEPGIVRTAPVDQGLPGIAPGTRSIPLLGDAVTIERPTFGPRRAVLVAMTPGLGSCVVAVDGHDSRWLPRMANALAVLRGMRKGLAERLAGIERPPGAGRHWKIELPLPIGSAMLTIVPNEGFRGPRDA